MRHSRNVIATCPLPPKLLHCILAEKFTSDYRRNMSTVNKLDDLLLVYYIERCFNLTLMLASCNVLSLLTCNILVSVEYINEYRVVLLFIIREI